MQTILIFSIILILYIYLFFPILLVFSRKRYIKITENLAVPEPLTIVFVVFNEDNRIRQKLENLLTQTYPQDKIQIFVASDGSTDQTNEILKSYEDQKIKPFIFSDQRGKALRLNQLMQEIKTPLTVLCDVRQEFHQDAIAELVKNFNDPEVGAVSGELVLIDDKKSTVDLSLYWQYEKYLRKAESKIDSTNGVTGAIYALRTELFKPIPEDTILDDVLIPMQIVNQGYRVLFEPKAIAYDKVQSDGNKEYKRKVRTLAGNFQLIVNYPWLLNPFKNRIFIQYFSHKFLRLLVPFLLIILFIDNLILIGQPFFNFIFALQLLFHVTGIVCLFLQKKDFEIKNKFLRINHTFYSLNIAVLEGLFQFLFKKDLVKWK